MAGLFCWRGYKFVGGDIKIMSSQLFTKTEIGMLAGGLCLVGIMIASLPAIASLSVVHGADASSVAALPPPQSPLSHWLDRLEEAESQDSGDRHLKVLDVNDQYSYGCLQFQAATFLKFGKMYGLVSSSLMDVEPLIYDCDLQKQMATDMIEGDYGNWRQWFNSVNNIVGLPPHTSIAIAAGNP